MKIEDIKPGLQLEGIEPGLIISVDAVKPISAEAIQIFYKKPNGDIRERLITSIDAQNIRIALVERPWSFDGDGDAFKLTIEAKRIDLAFLFDPMMAGNEDILIGKTVQC